MTISQLHKSAITIALQHGLSFALFRDKNSDKFVFICDDNSKNNPRSNAVFFAVNWLDPFAKRIEIYDRLSIDQVIHHSSTSNYSLAEPILESTNEQEYIKSVSELITELKASNGKTVISRVIAIKHNTDIASLTENYFAVNANTYCCLLHTPLTGCWLIASPEVLLEANLQTKELNTVALAGTRPANVEKNWDEKNLLEQQMVRDFIVDKFKSLNFQYKVSDVTTVQTNNIEHLATYISGKYSEKTNIETIIDNLCPTPALCGIPRDTSIKRINNIEKHQRRLYGGYFGLYDNFQFKAIVTLRCAQLSLTDACIYAGGGITASSIAQSEWEETTLKSQIIADIITKFNHEER